MNAEQKKWFEEFADRKRDEIQSLDEGGDKKIWEFISRHYSDKAHFLYELIQNADDVGATQASFELYAGNNGNCGCLVFRHNGKKHFEITKPAPRNTADFEIARKDKTLDSVYSICTVGNSTKDINDIGKFGIGFKSVFLYTDTPRVYDDGISFEISDFVVPRLLESEFNGRNKGETVFEFPFNRSSGEHLPLDPCKDVLDKLKGLILPTLFLRNLETVSWRFGEFKGQYVTCRTELYAPNDESDSKVYHALAECIECGDKKDEEFILIERPIEKGSKLNLTIGFKVSDEELTPVEYAPFCYFATQVSFGLKFIVNAPFVLTSTRQSLDFASDESISSNSMMMDGLSSLLADSLVYLRDLGKTNPRHVYLTENIFKILPLDENFVPKQEMDKLNIQRNDPNNYFAGFYLKPLNKFQEEEIIPCSLTKGVYCRSDNACYAEVKNIVENFDDSDLSGVASEFIGLGTEPRWVYAQTYDYALSERARATNQYVESIGARRIKAEEWVRALAGSYVEGKSKDANWLQKFYGWLSKRPEDEKIKAKHLPIILNQNSHACPAEIHGAANLYLPEVALDGEIPLDVNIVREDIHAWEGVQSLERSWRIGKFDTEALSSRLIQQLKESCDSQRRDKVTCQLLTLLSDKARVSVEIADRVATALREFGVFKAQDGNLYPSKSLYKYSEEWSGFKNLIPGSGRYFVDWNKYTHIGPEEVLESIGITSTPVVLMVGPEYIKDIYGNWLKTSDINWQRDKPEYCNSPTSKTVSYLDEVGVELSFKSLQFSFVQVPVLESLLDLALSDVPKDIKGRCEEEIWRILLAIAKTGDKNVFQGEYIGVTANSQIRENGRAVNPDREEHKQFSSFIRKQLLETRWIVCGDELIKPNGVDSTKIPRRIVNSPNYDVIAHWLNITTAADVEEEKTQRRADLNEQERKLLELAEKISLEKLEQLAKSTIENTVNADGKGDGTNIRQRNVTDEEKFLALGEDVKAQLDKIDKQQALGGTEDILGDKTSMVITVPQLLKMNLRIPEYQRPYKWEKDNVWDFMDDISRIVEDKEKNGKEWTDLPYRMGSIILHKGKSADGTCVYNIVDGQQRTLTFILLAVALGIDCDLLKKPKFYPALIQMPDSRRNLNNNLCYIMDYLKIHGGDCRAKFKEAFTKSLQVVAVCVAECDYAFQLFDSQNVKGRRLEPHDLLKAYHLRELDFAREKEDSIKDLVKKWEDFDVQDLSYLFDKLLYPILKWSEKERCYGFSTKDLRAFKGVPQRWRGKYGYVDNAFAAVGRFRIGTEFAPGKEFFDMVSHYQVLLKMVREKVESCPVVKDIMKNGSSNAYTKALFESVLLAYFDRFGLELPLEDINAAIKTLCKWVYSARLDLEYFSPKTPNKYALGVVDGSSNYTNRIAMFFAIRNAVFHTDIAKMAVEMSNSAKENQKTEARKSLWDLVNAL